MNLTDLPFFNPRDEIVLTENRLPHWQQRGRAYFLTYRLADAVPKCLLEQ